MDKYIVALMFMIPIAWFFFMRRSFHLYSYTRIGRLDNPIGLADALGGGNVSITFEK